MTLPLTVHFPVLGTHIEVEILDYEAIHARPGTYEDPPEPVEFTIYRWRIGDTVVDMADHAKAHSPFWTDVETLTDLAIAEYEKMRMPDYGPDDL